MKKQMPDVESIQNYVAERDRLVIEGDMDKIIAFMRKHNPNLQYFPNKETAEIMLHKCRVAIKSIPEEMRKASEEWLKAHGYRVDI